MQIGLYKGARIYKHRKGVYAYYIPKTNIYDYEFSLKAVIARINMWAYFLGGDLND